MEHQKEQQTVICKLAKVENRGPENAGPKQKGNCNSIFGQ